MTPGTAGEGTAIAYSKREQRGWYVYDWANSVLQRAISLLREVGDLPQLARAVNMQGLALWHRGWPGPALNTSR